LTGRIAGVFSKWQRIGLSNTTHHWRCALGGFKLRLRGFPLLVRRQSADIAEETTNEPTALAACRAAEIGGQRLRQATLGIALAALDGLSLCRAAAR
jgi:hypothetical protein